MIRLRFRAHRFSHPSPWIATLLFATLIGACQPAEHGAASRTPDLAPTDTAPVIIEPGAVFVWSRDGRAELYRIELFDESGQILGGAVTRDTTVPADAIVPDTARAGTWRVVPVSAGGTELPASEPKGFRRR